MSGGFFRGTSADQDTRFSNKQAKLLKSQKFAPELEHLVDMTKVQMDVIRPWIANRATKLLGFEDEVLINFIYGLLDGKAVDGKKVQIQLTGFMEKNTGKFMKELWILLLSAQKNISGIPQQFLDAKEEETKKKNAEADRIATELQKMKEKEGITMFEQEKHNRTDGELAKEDTDSNSRQCAPRDSDAYSKEEKKRERHGSRQKNGISMSTKSDDHSLSHQDSPSEIRESKSFSNSRSYSDGRGRSKSISTSPLRRRRSISIDQHRRSPPRQTTPIRGKHSLGNTRSPMRGYSPLSLHQNRSPQKHKSRSPQRHTSRSPRRYRNRSPRRYRSPSPRRYRSPPSRRYRSPSPRRYRSPSPRRYRSPSPRRLKSPSPRRYRSPKSRFSNSNRRRSFSPQHMSPLSRRSLSLSLEKSPSPLRRRSPFLRKRSLSPNVSPSPRLRSPSPLQQRSPSQQQRSISPQGRSPSSKQWKSSIPLKRSSSPPLRKSPSLQWQRSSSLTRDRSLSPPRKRSPFLHRRRSPPPQRQRSPRPRQGSPRPRQGLPRPRQGSPRPRRRSSPPQQQRSLSPQQRSFPLRRSQSPRKRLSSPAKKRLQSPRFSKQEKTLVRSSKRGHSPDESNSPHGYQRASSRDHGDYDNDKEPIIYRDGYAFQRSWEKSSPVHHSSIRKGVDRPTSSGDVSKHPLISLRSPQRDSKENNDPHYKQSPSPKHSSIFSRSPSPKHSISSDVEVRSVSPSLSSEKKPKVRSDRHDSSDTNRKLSHSRSDLSRKNVKQATIIQDQKRPSSSLDQEGYSSDSIHAIQSVEVQRRVRARKNENDQS